MAVCDAGKTFAEYLTDFEFIQALTCQYADPVGFTVTGMIVMAGLSLAIYIRTDSLMIPFALVLVSGGGLLSLVASPLIGFATILVIGVGAATLTWLYTDFSG